MKSLGEFASSSLAATVLQGVIRIAKTMVLLRLLGPVGRGIYGLFITITSLIISFGNLGFGLGSVYLVAKKKYELRKILGNALLYVVVQGVLLMAVGLVLLSFKEILKGNQNALEQIGMFVLIAIPFLLSYHLGLDLLMGIKDIHFMNILQIAFSAFPLLLLILLWVLTGNALQSAMVAWILTVIIISVCSFFRVYRKAGGRPLISLPYIKETFSFGLRGNLSIFANAVVRRIDLLFIAHYMEAKDVGYYAASVSIAEILLALPNAVSGPFLPIRFELDKTTGRKFSPLVVKYVLLVMALVCGLTALLGKPAIMILGGAEYLPALGPLQWLLPGILALSIYPFLKVDIYNLNRPGFVSCVSVLTMVCNLILNYLMIPRYGTNGAAISSSISYALSTLILLAFFLRETNQKVSDVLLVKMNDVRFLMDWFKRSRSKDLSRSPEHKGKHE